MLKIARTLTAREMPCRLTRKVRQDGLAGVLAIGLLATGVMVSPALASGAAGATFSVRSAGRGLTRSASSRAVGAPQVIVRCTAAGLDTVKGSTRLSGAQATLARTQCAKARSRACTATARQRVGGRARGVRARVSRSRECGRALRRRLTGASAKRKRASTRTAGAAATTTGDSLTIDEIGAGFPMDPPFASYYNNRGGVYCSGPGGTFYTGDVYAPCAHLLFNDAVTGTVAPPNNSSSDAEYDACGNLVGSSTSYSWGSTSDPNHNMTNGGGWVGGQDEAASPSACPGTWTIVYSFTETFSDGTSLTANATGTFTVKGDQILGTGETMGGGNPALKGCLQGCVADPVNTASGDYWESKTDLAIGGRGPGLEMQRTYSSVAAAQGQSSAVGPGWSFDYGESLSVDAGSGSVTITQGNGSQTVFTLDGSGGYAAPDRVLASLVHNSDGTWTYKLRARTIYTFTSAGKLSSIADLNANKITMAYNASGQLATATDDAARSLTFAYDASGRLASVTDSAGRKVIYTHDSAGDLTMVTDVRAGQWKYGYDTGHLLLTRQDANANTAVTNTYDATGRTLSQTDALGHKTAFAFTGSPSTATQITDPNGNVTEDDYTNGLLMRKTRAVGTSSAAGWSYAYDLHGSLGRTSVTDPNGHTTTYAYDSQGNQTSSKDPLGHTTSATYDSLNDVLSHYDQMGVATTYTYDSRGNRLTSSTPLSGTTQTQAMKYAYADSSHPGDVTSITDPTGAVTTFTYTAAGDLASNTDPAGNKTTYTYDALGRRLTRVSPRGNVRGATASQYTTTYAYDATGNLLTTTDPLGHKRTRTYDPAGNLLTATDANNHTTTYEYDAAIRRVKTTRADGGIVRSVYDANGNLTTQTDAAGHDTTYTYDALDRRASRTDALSRTTTYAYDLAGNVLTTVDASGRTTTRSYDANDRIVRMSYSDGQTPTVTYGYDANDRRVSLTDATGTSTSTYDSLGRLTKTLDGRGASTTFSYDLADHQTSITYPNAKTVTRTFDAAGRTATITDWLGGKTTFAYDADSQPTSTTFPTASKNVDTYTYDNTDQLSTISIAGWKTTLATLTYTRDNNGQITNETPTGLPGTAQTVSYDTVDRVTQAGSKSYAYDVADHPITIAGTSGYTYDTADQLTQSPTATYTYDTLGQRTRLAPTTGTPTTYAYDQAGRLTSLTTSSTTSYAYDGDGVRTSKTTGSTTTPYTWDQSTRLPLLLTDGATSYIYDPQGRPLEQISNGGTVSYYHHDQLGSTRMLTSATGTVSATYSYDAYGNQTGATGTATTPFGFAGEYKDADTGLIYLRARYYDPSTAQYLTKDALTAITGQPYSYANDDPVNNSDPSGLCSINPFSSGSCLSDAANAAVGVGATVLHAGLDVAAIPPYVLYYGSYQAAHAINTVGSQLGAPGEVVSHVLAAPLAIGEALGLAGDVGIDWIKGHTVADESICDEGFNASTNPFHQWLPGGPQPYLPGIHRDGSVDFEW
jgi:RHS repeat-associated protein